MGRKRLVVFDYSGTLSLESAFFSRPERLRVVLQECGLADLGIVTPDIFWRDIVNPTWDEGSTTGIGYARLMKRCVRERAKRGFSDEMVDRAVTAFVSCYFERSVVHAGWRPLLERMVGDQHICCVVATDHYAEATGYAIMHLRALGINALSINTVRTVTVNHAYMANSADIGAQKADALFWERIRSILVPGGVTDVTLIDDFGCNETAGDAYAASGRVASRKVLTESLLKDVFAVPLYAIPFVIEEPVKGAEPDEAQKRIVTKIDEVSARVMERFQ
jgi:hypothetical protein